MHDTESLENNVKQETIKEIRKDSREELRRFWINDTKRNRYQFADNYISTTRYTPWNFIPLNLFN